MNWLYILFCYFSIKSNWAINMSEVVISFEKNNSNCIFQRWTVNRQMKYEGGFQGRTNKLVDGCYSFWQGGVLPLVHMILTMEGMY